MQNLVFFAVGNDGMYSQNSSFAGNPVLRVHSSTPKRGGRGQDKPLELPIVWVNFSNQAAVGVAGMSVVNARYIAQNHQGIGVHRGCHQACQFVVVGKHQFGDSDCIVFIDDGHNFVAEQTLQAGLHVEVMLPVAKIFLGDE